MGLVVTSEGTVALMGFLQRGIMLSPFVGLFTNNVFPDQTFTLASLVEPVFAGYTRKPMGPPIGLASLPGGGSRLTWGNVVWIAGDPPPVQTCYGYFVVQLDWLAVPRLLWLERMSPSAVLPLPTNVLQLSPLFDYSSLFL